MKIRGFSHEMDQDQYLPTFLQLPTFNQPNPWLELPDKRHMSETQRYQLSLQASFFASYLREPAPDDSAFLKDFLIELRKCATQFKRDSTAAAVRYKTEIEEATKVISQNKPIPDTNCCKLYVEALWLTSRLLGTPAALLLGCTAKKRSVVRLRSGEFARIISFIAKETYRDASPHLEDDIPDQCMPSYRHTKGLALNNIRLVADCQGPTVPSKRKFKALGDGATLPIVAAKNDENHRLNVYHANPQAVNQEAERIWRKLSNAAKTFFRFLCELGKDNIPEILVIRMMKQNEGWDRNGKTLRSQIPRVDHIFEDLVSGKAYDFTMIFVMIRFILEKPGEFDRNLFVIPHEIKASFSSQGAPLSHPTWQRLLLVCHAFPGCWEEAWFADTGRVLLPQLQAAIRGCPNLKSIIIDNPKQGFRVLLSLILSSKIPGPDWKVEALDIATDILESKPDFGDSDSFYLRSILELRKTNISRRLEDVHFGQTSSASALLSPVDPRSNSVHGAMLRSQAQECIMTDPRNLNAPFDILRRFTAWDPSNPSEMERHELDLRDFFLGRIQRWKANFESASSTFTRLTEVLGSNFDETGCGLWSHHIATLCELHRFQEAEHWSRWVVRGYEDLREQIIHTGRQKRYRLLRLALAETLVSKSIFIRKATNADLDDSDHDALDQADAIFDELLSEIDVKRTRDWSSRFEHLRARLGKALVSYIKLRFAEAQALWENLRKSARHRPTKHQTTVFLEMVIDYCLSDLAAKQNNYNEAHHLLHSARSQFASCGREYFFTCIGSDFLDLLSDSLGRMNLVSGITCV